LKEMHATRAAARVAWRVTSWAAARVAWRVAWRAAARLAWRVASWAAGDRVVGGGQQCGLPAVTGVRVRI